MYLNDPQEAIEARLSELDTVTDSLTSMGLTEIVERIHKNIDFARDVQRNDRCVSKCVVWRISRYSQS